MSPTCRVTSLEVLMARVASVLGHRKVMIPPRPAPRCRHCRKNPVETGFANNQGLCEDCWSLMQGGHHRGLPSRVRDDGEVQVPVAQGSSSNGASQVCGARGEQGP